MSMDRGDRDRLRDDSFEQESRSGISPALVAVVAVIIVVFVLQNRDRTEIDFLVFEVRSRVWVALAIAIGLGVLLDRVVLTWWRRRRRRTD
jgi:uncharacterized integral membrane protein